MDEKEYLEGKERIFHPDHLNAFRELEARLCAVEHYSLRELGARLCDVEHYVKDLMESRVAPVAEGLAEGVGEALGQGIENIDRD